MEPSCCAEAAAALPSAAENVLLNEDLCETLCKAMHGIPEAAALASAAPRASPLRRIAKWMAFELFSRHLGDPCIADFCLPAPCAVGSSIRGGEYKLCSHGLCRAKPSTLRQGVLPLLNAVLAHAREDVICYPVAGRVLELLALCRDACGVPSERAWQSAADRDSVAAQLRLANASHRQTGHAAAKEAASRFIQLTSNRNACARVRASAHLQLGFIYLDGGVEAGEEQAVVHLQHAASLGLTSGDATVAEAARKGLLEIAGQR